MKWLYLIIAIISEVIATTSLKLSEQFTKLIPSTIVVIGYICSFYFLSVTMKYFHIGIVYAIWSGAGILLITVAGFFLFKQQIDIPAVIGMVLIAAGIVFLNLFSKSMMH